MQETTLKARLVQSRVLDTISKGKSIHFWYNYTYILYYYIVYTTYCIVYMMVQCICYL